MNVLQLKLCLLLWTVMNHLVQTRGGSLKLHTARQSTKPYLYTKLSSYGYEVGSSTCIVFEYKGCDNALVGLMREDDDSTLMYDINIGGWSNTKSVVRPTKYSDDFIATRDLSGVVDCHESRKFKIGWKDGKITTYRWVKPCKWEILMSWHKLNNAWCSVNYIGVTTGEWANGDWVIANEECHEAINQNTLWKKDITRKDTLFSLPMFIKSDIDSSHQCAMQCYPYSECCYYTYNGRQRDCRGYSNTGSSNAFDGTELWIRY